MWCQIDGWPIVFTVVVFFLIIELTDDKAVYTASILQYVLYLALFIWTVVVTIVIGMIQIVAELLRAV